MKRTLSILLIAFGLAVLPACTGTITPAPVAASQASFDGDVRNSGIIDLLDAGFVVTPRFRERYNYLVGSYGRAWAPAVVADYGITPRADGTFLVSREAMEKFLTMNAWRRMGREDAK